MKKYFMAFVLGTSLITLAACGGGGNGGKETSGDGEFAMVENAEAEELFNQSCIGCHGGNMEGGSGPSLQKVGSKYSEEEIKNIILNGKGSMPVVINDENEAATLAGWLAEHK